MTQALPLADSTLKGPNRKQRRQAERKARRKRQPSLAQDPRWTRAGELHKRGRLADAEALYRELVAVQGETPLLLARLGAVHLQSGRARDAVETLERARRGLPQDASICTNLGHSYAALDRQDKAEAAHRQALAVAPDDPETLKNFGAWCLQQKRFDEAIAALQKALAAAPDDAPRWNALAQCCTFAGRSEEALASSSQALRLKPEDPSINGQHGAVLAHLGRADEALPHLIKGFPALGKNRDYQVLFSEAVRSAAVEPNREGLDEALLTCFQHRFIDVQKLASVAGAQIWSRTLAGAQEKAEGGAQQTSLHLEGILGDPLLLALLSKAVNKNVGLEALLVPLRRSVLDSARQKQGLSRDAMRFMACFAMQCHHNSYLYPVTAPETEEIERLRERIEQRLAGFETAEPALELDLALIAMYRPLHGLRGFERLAELPPEAWSEELRPLIELSLLNPAEEEALKTTIPSFGSIEDSVSKAVRSQYEENPYPRWTVLAQHPLLTFADHLRLGAPYVHAGGDVERNADCLIAGCGTGQHPINVASALRDCHFTAVDLSLASLAYAKRMARRYGVENIDFLHGDLLDIAALGKDYDWIESAGVLHHMEQPERGLESLLRVLRPKGYLRLGLYSRTARRWINDARSRVEEIGLEPTPEAMREFRRRIAVGQEPGRDHFVTLGDFYDLDSFRDLVFHVQEHQYSALQIKDMLARHGLAFCGFVGLPAKVFESFSERFPGRDSLVSLDRWAAFEQDHPDSFIGMYEFWCRNAG